MKGSMLSGSSTPPDCTAACQSKTSGCNFHTFKVQSLPPTVKTKCSFSFKQNALTSVGCAISPMHLAGFPSTGNFTSPSTLESVLYVSYSPLFVLSTSVAKIHPKFGPRHVLRQPCASGFQSFILWSSVVTKTISSFGEG